MSLIIQLFKSKSSQDAVFKSLVGPHITPMYQMAYRWTQNQDDAEDLVQDVLIKIVNRIDEIQKVDKLRPWLIKVLYHRYVDLYRNQRSSPIDDNQEFDENHLTEHHLKTETMETETVDLQQQLNLALQALEPFQRDIVLMHDVEGYTALEIAEILEVNVGTVKSRLHRARSKLKNSLNEGTFSTPATCE